MSTFRSPASNIRARARSETQSSSLHTATHGKTVPPFMVSSFFLSVYVFSAVGLSKTSGQLASISQFIGFGLAIIFTLEFFQTRQRLLHFPQEFSGYLVFLIWVGMGIFWAESTGRILTTLITLVQLIGFAVIAYNIIIARKNSNSFVIGFILGLIWLSYTAFSENDFSVTRTNPDRVGAAVTNANLYSLFLVIGLLLLLRCFWNRNPIHIKVLAILLSAIFIYQVVFFTGSVKGMLGLLFIAIIFIFLNQQKTKAFPTNRLLYILISTSLVAMVSSWIIEQSPHSYRLNLEESRNVEIRQNLINFGLEKWQAKPLTGYGARQFSLLWAKSHWNSGEVYSHNNYVELLVNHGLIGAIFYYVFFVALYRSCLNVFLKRATPLITNDLPWTIAFIFVLLFWDIAAVSYNEKYAWLSYTLLIANLRLLETKEV